MKDKINWNEKASFGSVKPIEPKEVSVNIPDFVILAVNKLIQEKWDGVKAEITQDEIMAVISSNDENDSRPPRQTIYNNHWLDIEDTYRKAGWNVKYDKPGFNEDYDAYFVFRKS